jgi:thioredoxin 1
LSDNVQTFTDANWDSEVLKSAQPVLVDFWAEWCVPCKALVPIFEQVATQYGAKLRVGKLNAEENNDVPFRYNVTGLPTILLLKGGQVVEQRVGLVSKEKLLQLLEPHVGR